MSMFWRCTGASAQGQSHARRNTPCQDAHGCAQVNDTLILAVADGAGSARCAEKGSAVAVESVLDFLVTEVPLTGSSVECEDMEADIKATLLSAFRTARNALELLAEKEEIRLRDLATTLLVTVVTPGFSVAAQIGDGAIVYAADDHNCVAALTVPTHGEYVNETEFLTQPNYLERVQFNLIKDPVGYLALFSDGLESVAVKFSSGEPYPAFFTGLFQFMKETAAASVRAEAITRLLQGRRLAERSDDDKTLLLAIRHDRSGGDSTS